MLDLQSDIAPAQRIAGKAQEPCLAVREIEFLRAGPAVAEFAVVFANLGDCASEPTVAQVGAAPFGAFAVWRPVLRLAVPSIPAAASRRVPFCIRRASLAAPGATPSGPLRGGDIVRGLVGFHLLLASITSQLAADARAVRSRLFENALPPDLFERRAAPARTYWAGNLNIFVSGQAVERHLARALRACPGHVNLAMFVVGDGQPDIYRFALDAPQGWQGTVMDGVKPVADEGIAATSCVLTLVLAIPADAQKGRAIVRVRRRSTGESAAVEFDLSPTAAGPGCYRV
jgi:hypothetical protein